MTTFMWTEGSLAEVTPMLGDIRAANVDVVMSYSAGLPSNAAAITDWLDAVYDHGMMAMVNLLPIARNVVKDRGNKTFSEGELATITAYVSQFKSHPALWGWYCDDEGTAAQYPIASRQQVYDTIKAAHPEGNVFEVHWKLESGGYSPDVHDYFFLDAGISTDEAYLYRTDDLTALHGCIDYDTGLVSNRTAEATLLAAYEANLTALREDLDTAGEVNYGVCFQAFQMTNPTTDSGYAFPPAAADGYDGGITRMFDAAISAGFTDHAGWYVWKVTPDSYDVHGASYDGRASQRAEIAALADSIGGGYGFGDFDIRLAGSYGDFDIRLQAILTTRRRQRIANLGGF